MWNQSPRNTIPSGKETIDLENKIINKIFLLKHLIPDVSDFWSDIAEEEGLDLYDTKWMGKTRELYIGLTGIIYPEEENKKDNVQGV